MALQARLGLLQGKTTTELATGAGKYLEELDKTATLLGTSRKEQEDARTAVLANEKLRAAMLVAEEEGDTEKSALLGRYLQQATELQAKGLTKESAGFADLAASGGAVISENAGIAKQMFSNDTFKKLNEGTATAIELTRQVAKETQAAYYRSAKVMAATGADTGMTGGTFGKAADMNTAVKLQEKAAAAAAKQGLKEGTPEYNKFFEDFLVAQKKATDDESDKANKLRMKQRDDNVAQDKRLMTFADDFGVSTKIFSVSVNKMFTGGKSEVPGAGSARGLGSAAATNQAVRAQLSNWGGERHKGKTADDLLSYGGGSGSKQNFEGLNQGMQDRVLAAAEDFNSLSGGKLKITSANRSPEEQNILYEATKALGTPGRGPEGRPVAKPGESRHESGRAVDIQNYNDPKAVAAMNKQGLFQNVPKDDVHFEQAMTGGLFNGSNSGYPVTLHGREAVVPMPDPSAKLKVEKNELSSVTTNNSNSVSESTSNTMTNMFSDVMEMMSSKMDEMIDRLDMGNNYSDKLVKAMA